MISIFLPVFILLLLISSALPQHPPPPRVLFAFAPDSLTQLRSVLPLANKLASSGFHPHLLHFSSDNDPISSANNVSLIRVPSQLKTQRKMEMQAWHIWHMQMHTPVQAIVYAMTSEYLDELVREQPEKLVQLLNADWALMVVGELFAVPAYALALFLNHNHQVPVAMFSTTSMTESMEHWDGWAREIDRWAMNLVHIFHISSDTKGEKFGANVSLIPVPISRDKMDGTIRQLGTHIWTGTFHSPMLAMAYHMLGQNFGDLIEQHPDKLAQVLNSPWDLVIAGELFCLHAYAFASLLSAHHRVPYVLFSPAMMMGSNTFHNALGHSWVTHPHPFSTIPRHFHDNFCPRAFLHRLTNVLESLGEMGAARFIDQFVIGPRLAPLTGHRHFDFGQLYARSELALVDSIDLLAFPQPTVPEVVSAGAHCEVPSTLPEDYRRFVEDPKSKGTIYVAFGTVVPWDYAPAHVAPAFFDAFERITDHRFIFSFRGQFPNRTLSPHIRLVSWAPQLELLAHPRTRVFLTHCGLKSIKESLCTSTPMLAMPMFAEQAHNAKMVLEFGTGVTLNKFSIDAEQVYIGLRELLDNPKYAQRVAKLRRIFLDRPVPALDLAQFRLSRIIRGTPQRLGRNFHRRKGAQMGIWDSFHLDAIVALMALALLISK